jgi:hypothetical protein
VGLSLVAWDQPVPHPAFVDQRYHSPHLVHRGILLPLFILYSLQPLLDLQRLDTKRNPLTPTST